MVTTGPNRRRRCASAVLVALALVGLASCQPRRALWSPAPGSTYGMAVLTRDGTDSYETSATEAGLHVEALASNAESNTRLVLWPKGVSAVADGESCATWTSRTGSITQQGAVLRVVRNGTQVRAITVTQNIYLDQRMFNFHTWDSSRAGDPFRQFGQIDMRRTFFAKGTPPFPWHFCARAIGDSVSFKIWTDDEAEPDWGDSVHGGTATLPAGWRQTGQTGWYAGHLKATDHATFDDISLWTYDPQSDRSTSSPNRTAESSPADGILIRGS